VASKRAIRRRSCAGKVAYATAEIASKRRPPGTHVYPCEFPRSDAPGKKHYHVGHPKDWRTRRAMNERSYRAGP
jgi:hypothetical protein